jgi:hypothetical protein
MKIFFALLLIFSPFAAGNLFACSCGNMPPVYENFKESFAVFTGKVVGSKDIIVKKIEEYGEKKEYFDKERIFEFEIIEAFKGVKGRKVNISNGSLNSMCREDFEIGESYLVYARGKDEKKLVSNNFCSRNENLAQSQTQIYFIRELLKGKPEPQFYGSVHRNDTFPNTIDFRATALDSMKVVLIGKEKTIESLTDKNGIFRFTNIPEGEYKVKIEMTPIYKDFYEEVDSITVEKGKVGVDIGMGFFPYEAVFAEYAVGWNNSVEGVVYDAQGTIIKRVAVRLLPVSTPFAAIESNYLLDKSEDGKYSCSRKTPGRYYLVAEIYAPFENKEKTRIFFPQTESFEKATVFDLKAIDQIKLDFILPAKYVVREIKGTVFWSDGEPVSGATVTLYKTETQTEIEDDDTIENHGYDYDFTDEQGNFTLQGFENVEYWVHVEGDFETSEDDEDIEVKAKPVKIKFQKTNEPLKIILPKP